MFGIVGMITALLMIGTSALANLYNAGKYSSTNKMYEMKKTKDLKNSAILAFFIGVISLALMILF